MTGWSNFRGAAGVLSFVAAVLPGCGGGGGGSSSTATAPTTTTPPVTPTVATTVAPLLTAPTATYSDAYSQAAFARVNAVRLQAGLGALVQDTSLDQAAWAHSNYQAVNGLTDGTHSETAGQIGFTGSDISSRLAAAGYTQGSIAMEVVEPGAGGSESVDELMSIVYHRAGILKPLPREMGVGVKLNTSNGPRFLTMEFGTKAGETSQRAVSSYAVWPADGSANVPTIHLKEIPNPLDTAWCAPTCPGYAVSIHLDDTAATMSSFVLHDSVGGIVATKKIGVGVAGDTVSSTLGAPVQGFFAAIPLAPLAPNATYSATFVGTAGGQAINKTWSFTTRANVVTTAQTAFTVSRAAQATAGDRLVLHVIAPSGYANAQIAWNSTTNAPTPIICDRGASASLSAILQGGDAQLVPNMIVSDSSATCVATISTNDPVTGATGPIITITSAP